MFDNNFSGQPRPFILSEQAIQQQFLHEYEYSPSAYDCYDFCEAMTDFGNRIRDKLKGMS
jgi:hypothetical protein